MEMVQIQMYFIVIYFICLNQKNICVSFTIWHKNKSTYLLGRQERQ